MSFSPKRYWTEFSVTSKMAANPLHGNSVSLMRGANIFKKKSMGIHTQLEALSQQK